jgi:hypothetical protein
MMAFERRWARHLLAAFAPAGSAGLSPSEHEVDYLGVLTRMMRETTPLAALGLRLAIWMAALAPLWLWGRISTISKLKSDRRTQLLVELLAHRVFAVRELSLLLKLCAAMALLGAPSMRQRSGYDHVEAPGKSESGLRVRLPLVANEGSLRVWQADPANDAIELPTSEVR